MCSSSNFDRLFFDTIKADESGVRPSAKKNPCPYKGMFAVILSHKIFVFLSTVYEMLDEDFDWPDYMGKYVYD